jgi:hypothetical protein
MPRTWYRHICCFLIAALLSAQALVAAHACDRVGTGPAHAIEQMKSAGNVMSDADGCCEAASQVCHKHCENESGNADSVGSTALLAYVPSLLLRLQDFASERFSALSPEPALLHAASPPATIRHCCWRI